MDVDNIRLGSVHPPADLRRQRYRGAKFVTEGRWYGARPGHLHRLVPFDVRMTRGTGRQEENSMASINEPVAEVAKDNRRAGDPGVIKVGYEPDSHPARVSAASERRRSRSIRRRSFM